MKIPSFLDFFDSPRQSTRIAALEGSMATMADSLQAAIGVYTGDLDGDEGADVHYTGNPYSTYTRKVTALTKMYAGRKKWGCDTAKNVVDVRAAFIIGSGVRAVKSENYPRSADREIKFIREFLSYNNLDKEAPNEWSQGVEIEGQFLCRLDIRERYKTVKATYIPWYNNNYGVETPDDQPKRYVRATWNDAGGHYDLPESEFTYRRFSGTSPLIDAPSKAAMVLKPMEDLDKAYWDWRHINHLYASPTPVFTFEIEDTAKKFYGDAQYKNWRIGKGIVLARGEFKLVCYSGEGYTTVKDEIRYHVRRISSITGVPIHFLGYPDLLSNRDTADNLIEGFILSTKRERETWIGSYEEIFRKAIELHNAKRQQDLDPMAITAFIPAINSAKVIEIENMWLPMYIAGALSLETLLRQIPDIDIDREVIAVKIQQEQQRKKDEAISKSNNSVNVRK